MAAKRFHRATYREQTLKKCLKVGFRWVLSQVLHGGDSSTCPSKNITKSGSISIVNPTHTNINLWFPIMQSMFSMICFFYSSYHCHSKIIAIDYIVKVFIIAHNEVYVFDHSYNFYVFPSIIFNYVLEIVLYKSKPWKCFCLKSTSP